MSIAEETPGVAGARPVSHPVSLPAALIPPLLLALMTCGYAVLFGWLSLSEYWAYETHALDMGNMGQAAWNTIHGHPFYFTNMRLPFAIEAWRTTTRLSFHVEALFPVISVVYLVYAHPESLLILQTIAVASGAVAAYLIARDVLRNAWIALVFAAAYLLHPTLEGLNLYEFHPVALATPLLLFAFYFMRRRQNVLFVLCCLAAMGCKEEIGLIVAMFGLYAALIERQRRVGFGLAVVGVAWSVIAVFVIEHHYKQPGTVTYFHSRYGYLGHGLSGVLHTATHDPGVFGSVLFTWPKLGYLLRLLGPLGYTPLLAPAALALGLPTFVLNLFSTDYHMTTGLGDNSAELVSVLVIASILGSRLLIRLLETWLPRLAAYGIAGIWVLGTALWGQHQDGFTPIGNAYHVPVHAAHQAIEDRFVAMIPPGVPVSTQDQLDPHLSSRHYLYLFQDTGRVPPLVPANYILLDVSAPTYPYPSYQVHDVALHWVDTPGWGVAAAEDGVILIERGARSRKIPSAFYSFSLAGSRNPTSSMHYAASGLEVRGYDRARADLANNHIPNEMYTFYMEAAGRPAANLQPVVYEVMGKSLISCAHEPLGLAWLPTSKWKPGTTYLVRMDPLATDWKTPGNAQVFMEIRKVPGAVHPDCGTLWASHGRLAHVGTIDIQF